VTDQKHREGVEYVANVTQSRHYFPFGLVDEEYSFINPDYEDAYRYGFNGKEEDADLQSDDRTNVVLDYGFRIYNPAIARFLSVDPLTKSYPWYTPYQFAGNKPIVSIDLDGKEELNYLNQWQYQTSQGTVTQVKDDLWMLVNENKNFRQFFYGDTESGLGFWGPKQEYYKHLQTGTGLGLSVADFVVSSDYTSQLSGIALMAIGAPLVASVGAEVGISRIAYEGFVSVARVIPKEKLIKGLEWSFRGTIGDRATAGATDIGTQLVFNEVGGSQYNYSSTLSAIAFPKRYLLSGVVGSGVELNDDGLGLNLSGAIVGGLTSYAGGTGGDALDKALKPVGISPGLSQFIQNLPLLFAEGMGTAVEELVEDSTQPDALDQTPNNE